MKMIKGQAFILGDNVDTDQILPGYAMSYPFEQLGTVALKGSAIPDFSEQVNDGDLVIGGENFGCGSSREQAPVALQSAGVGLIVAKSFARIFRRNAINIGLPVMTTPHVDKIVEDAEAGDQFSADVAQATLTNHTKNKVYELTPLSKSSLETVQCGGLIERVRVQLKQKGKSK